ncbi:MAG TPA: dihydropyrimidine dehydrogenase, partial [Aquificae bacterium]|nr:dihydropyrimidine dehydrogenase [Aquificota bacterium]
MKANKRINPPTRDPKERIKDFLPCVLPYSEEDAIKEASRCLDCKDPLCVNGCPINNPIPEFINLIKERKFLEAAQLIVEKGDVMPSVCGRVCQHEKQCEG